MGDTPRARHLPGLDLELLDPDNEDERTLLLEAWHLELEEALQREEEVTVRSEPVNPRPVRATRAPASARAWLMAKPQAAGTSGDERADPSEFRVRRLGHAAGLTVARR